MALFAYRLSARTLVSPISLTSYESIFHVGAHPDLEAHPFLRNVLDCRMRRSNSSRENSWKTGSPKRGNDDRYVADLSP